jgi:hypothetical protein
LGLSASRENLLAAQGRKIGLESGLGGIDGSQGEAMMQRVHLLEVGPLLYFHNYYRRLLCSIEVADALISSKT